MSSVFDQVDVDALRRRRTVKWSALRSRRARGLGRRDGLRRSRRRSGPRCSTPSTGRTSATSRPTPRSSPPPAPRSCRRPTDGTSLRPACSSWPTCWPASPSRWTSSSRRGPVVLLTPAYPPLLRRHRARRPAGGPGPARRPRGSGHVRPRRDRRRSAREPGRCCCASPTTRPDASSTSTSSPRLPRSSSAHGGRVVSDEVHAPLVYPGHHHVPYATRRPKPPTTPSR